MAAASRPSRARAADLRSLVVAALLVFGLAGCGLQVPVVTEGSRDASQQEDESQQAATDEDKRGDDREAVGDGSGEDGSGEDGSGEDGSGEDGSGEEESGEGGSGDQRPNGGQDASGEREGEGDSASSELGPLYEVLSVYDGDTLAVSIDGSRERIRVIGIDAPELGRDGGAADCFAQSSTSEMQSLVQSQRVHLLADPSQADRDRYDRLLRHVVREGGGHVGLIMVTGGFAEEAQFAAPYQYQADLLAAQEQARVAGLGLWSACAAPAPVAPVAPADPPVQPPPPPPPPPADTGNCVIKGNINNEGERIYHVPGQEYYDETVVTLSKGERWFCSEQDALDAGWRKARI